MFRYLNINDILKLLKGIVLSSIIFFVFAEVYNDDNFLPVNFDKTRVVNHLLLFFFSFSFLVSYRILIKIYFSPYTLL